MKWRNIQIKHQLCEPEVWLFVWQFEKVFEELFKQYSDFPTDLLGESEGHMSFGAFLRFLVDFQLFPQYISYNEWFDFYQDAECFKTVVKVEKEDDPAAKLLSKVCKKFKKGLDGKEAVLEWKFDKRMKDGLGIDWKWKPK